MASEKFESYNKYISNYLGGAYNLGIGGDNASYYQNLGLQQKQLGYQQQQEQLLAQMMKPGQVVYYDYDKDALRIGSPSQEPNTPKRLTNMQWLDNRVNEMRIKL